MGGRMIRRSAPILLLFALGCSTAPLADFLDVFRPGRVREEQGAPYGGVCQPKQPGGDRRKLGWHRPRWQQLPVELAGKGNKGERRVYGQECGEYPEVFAVA